MTPAAERTDEETVAVQPRKLASLRPRDLLLRFGFGAAVSAMAGGVTVIYGPRVGGLFLAFPAIMPATLTLLERKDGLPQAVSDVRGAILGAVGMAGFAAIAAALLARSPGLALAAALAGWALISLGLYGALRLIAATGEHQYLPEIPTLEAEPAIEALRAHGFTLGLAES